MGFFTDLKDDLSQAVNELMPEGEAEEKGTINSDEKKDLEMLLDKVDEVGLSKAPEKKVEEDFVPQPKVSEKKMDTMARSRYSDETAVITAGMVIRGDVSTEGSIDLIGTVIGNIETLGKINITGNIQGDIKGDEIYAEGAKITGQLNSQGSIKIGQSTVIIGNISATGAVIAGAVKGDIDVHGPVVLDTSAIVMGNIKSKSVQINNGAVIEGMCSQCYADVNPTNFFEDFKNKKAK